MTSEALALGLLMQNNGLIPRVIEKMGLNLQYIISELEKEWIIIQKWK